jgi:hypothetical protein
MIAKERCKFIFFLGAIHAEFIAGSIEELTHDLNVSM